MNQTFVPFTLEHEMSVWADFASAVRHETHEQGPFPPRDYPYAPFWCAPSNSYFHMLRPWAGKICRSNAALESTCPSAAEDLRV